MNIDHLIKMANEISSFWEGEAGQQAATEVASHLRRYWEPRMRARMITYYEERQGAGLSDVAKAAVALLAAQAGAAAASAQANAPGEAKAAAGASPAQAVQPKT
jgi:formate dehydrogenase subunit delta